MHPATVNTDTPPPDSPAVGLRWAVIGGGILGMDLARQLNAAGHAVTLIESAPHLGGLADAWQLGDVTWDRHYHVILLSDTRLRNLIDDLALTGGLRWVETKTGFYTDGKLYSMSNSLEFLKFPPLGLVSKFRLALTILRASKIRDWQYLEHIPVVDWLRKWSGRGTTEKIWLPLLRAKLGENYRHASAAFIWAIIARMYAARKTGLKKEMFGYLRGGYRTLLDRYTHRLQSDGVAVRECAKVSQITADEFCLGVEYDDGTHEEFDRVVITTTAPVAAKICPGLEDDERAKLLGLRYQGLVCASLLLTKPLDRFYVTNITDAAPFTAVIEMTTLVDPAEFGGKHLVYLPKYVSPDDPLFEQPDHKIRESFLAALAKMYPYFSPDDVLAFRVSRVRNVLAIPTLDYSAKLPPMATAVPGLFMVNSAHIVNGTLNVNETLQLADRAMPTLLAEVPR
ncbi:NAD(P)/FAD-dependent oxidoreductase [Limnoglobus roseus]|uniref:FAD-dependent oxidoreductase n=1 Tax=Limnoglobus roseus TaxID=2598579 RepID=A0A5C1A9Q1_9BACT|nr:NAD(P)/FAD-dependent oxidoreductase [Limnoglobus roseus]QEL15295.1 FAD-dependent oxidoreductase [Limnoglobus roseus]